MSEYKRLTTSNNRVNNKTPLDDGEQFIPLCDLYNRLAELEDKIENGTLIEVPCIRKCETCYQVIYEDKETKQVGYISYGLGQLDRAKSRLKELKGEV